MRRAAVQWEPFSETVAERLDTIRSVKRAEAARVFAPELAALAAPERDELAAALGAASAWTYWESLRAHRRLPYDRARAAMRRMLESLLILPPSP